MPWQPTRFKRFVESFGTSTLPARVVTDAGDACLKAINNPMGPQVLAREWVATQLAQWFGLKTFDFAIMNVDHDDEIPLREDLKAAPGPAFATRWVKGHP